MVGTGLGLLLLIGSPWIMRQDASSGVVVSVSSAIPVSLDASHDVPPQTDQSDTVASASHDDPDTLLRQQLVGVWTLQQHGQRTITIEPDGTARMVVELDWLGAMLYGKRLDITLTWSIDEGVMTQTMQGGEPEDTVKRRGATSAANGVTRWSRSQTPRCTFRRSAPPVIRNPGRWSPKHAEESQRHCLKGSDCSDALKHKKPLVNDQGLLCFR